MTEAEDFDALFFWIFLLATGIRFCTLLGATIIFSFSFLFLFGSLFLFVVNLDKVGRKGTGNHRRDLKRKKGSKE